MRDDKTIAFIGAGSMAESIIGGLLKKNLVSPTNITVTNHSNEQRLLDIKNSFGVNTTPTATKAVEIADIIILAMKPKHIEEAVASLKPVITENKLVLSVLAGVTTSYIEQLLDNPIPVVRVMPNTSAKVGASSTAVSSGYYAAQHHLDQAADLFFAIGTVTILEESHLDAVTGISGSGPAYFYYFVEAMSNVAKEAGLPEEKAKDLIIQTIYGAAIRLQSSHLSPGDLYNEVMSPGGTTEAAFQSMESHRLQESFQKAIHAAINQSKALGTSTKSYDVQ
ncbi:pyrroline-5-carboxylate reductase [Salibacterium salarium]|uniref:Pyrroline-5-carboxylate reductase n=2 Tax=Salibacterium salarium TaxID=284579 RepID=A0A428MYB7_9BACI|nr:pyrroline-5-carboxylate reductase [Salibacterium salarium]